MTTATLTQPIQVTQNEPSHMEVTLPNLPEAVTKLLSKRGQFIRLVMERDMKTLKGRDRIIKHTECTVRVGCDYENLSQVKEMRENGKQKSEMAWGTWAVFPILKEHKGQFYVRCATVKNNETCVPNVRYFQNDKEITKEQAQKECLASEFSEKDLIVFDVKVSNVVSINGELI
jgi:hypothetical protein